MRTLTLASGVAAVVVIAGLVMASAAPAAEYTLAGQGSATVSATAQVAGDVRLERPEGIIAATDGSLVFADGGGNRVLRLNRRGRLRVIAGTGRAGFGGDGGSASQALLNRPTGILELAGGLVIADSGNARLRYVSPDGVIMTIAGTGTEERGPDGSAMSTPLALGSPFGMALDASGSLLFPETYGSRVSALSSSGMVSTIAGSGGGSFAGDGGPATAAKLYYPTDVLMTANGLLIADTYNARIRRVDGKGTITTVAGIDPTHWGDFATPGSCCEGGDGGPATEAGLNLPSGLALSGDGSYYIADRKNHDVRRVTPNGIIGTIVRYPYDEKVNLGEDGPRDVAVVDGGIAVTIGNRIALITRRRSTPWTAVAVRAVRSRGRRLAIAVDATRAGRITLEVRADRRLLGRGQARVKRGRTTLRVRSSRSLRGRAWNVRARLRTSTGTATARLSSARDSASP